MGNEVFMDCKSLTSIVLPDDLMFLGEYAFCRCENLTSIEISDSVSILINDGTFSRCKSLTIVKNKILKRTANTIRNDVQGRIEALTELKKLEKKNL